MRRPSPHPFSGPLWLRCGWIVGLYVVTHPALLPLLLDRLENVGRKDITV